MGFLDKIQKGLRDKKRDNFCAGLQSLGIDAQMAARGRVEEKIPLTPGRSFGLIEIPEGPIRWINVRQDIHVSFDFSSTYYYTDYGVLDPRLGPDSPGIQIETIRVKNVPRFGKVVDVYWKGWDSDLGIISRLNNDLQLKYPIMKSRDITIAAIGDYSCWLISTEIHNPPSGELWSCYQTIAYHLLAEWSQNKR